ncbi:ATP-binding cassette domain-containing protein [Mycoplasma sp. Mirounga ES2805-ORL]|uniref:ATP-binding cassette domain-containing protein n=1 Tax=Mycoplasma sp. Mirounga ES2805-ORL TaxID=754514 RepID=UPI002738BA75|nr:ATP-binding cassette domain-containing protein [Mycoplasma sp. Mirounga ES2805-ORL]
MNRKDAKVILEIEGLKKYFTNNGIVNKAADDITFNLHEGEIVGLIGESGSGKTTVGRSLLRLYDDFNGFVNLNGQVISGKRLKRSQRKFLRRNIQMIFQDPHAALNSQKNIYSTLKEPLIVNGIIRDQISDIFKDWELIKENYYYTFRIMYKQLKLDNLIAVTALAKDFFPKWVKNFENYKYDESLNYEDNFNVFYNYLEDKQNMESEIVDNLYDNTDKLLSFYFEKQKDYRNGELAIDERELLDARNELKKTIALRRMSLKTYEAKNNIRQLNKEYADFLKENYDDVVASNKNTFSNYIREFKVEKKINFWNKLSARKIDVYLNEYKKELINKKLHSLVIEYSKKLNFLKYHEVKDFVKSIRRYSEIFFQNHFEHIQYSKDVKKELKDILDLHFNYDASPFLNKHNVNVMKFEKEKAAWQIELHKNKQLSMADTKPATTEAQVRRAQKLVEEKYKKHIEANEKFVKENESKIKELDENIEAQEKLYKDLVDLQTQTDNYFKKISEDFIKKINDDIDSIKKNKNHKNEYKELIRSRSIYKSRILTKQSTLKSFKIETRYLKKDINSIKILLGIYEGKFNRILAGKFGDLARKITFNFFPKFLVKNLLIKNTIYNSLEAVGLLKQFAYRYPHEFSGGQRQRIVIARALITQPKVIVADEPIASLDISIQAQVVNLLKDLCEKKNIGMIFIAHDLSMIEYIADRVQIMHLGKIVESGDTDVVYEKPIHPYTINLFKAIPKISNANEKFENINFELNYLDEQEYPNLPMLYQVEENHYIYGNPKQLEEWTKPFGIHDYKLVSSISSEADPSIKDLPFDGKDQIPTGVDYTLVLDSTEEKDIAFSKAKEKPDSSASQFNLTSTSFTLDEIQSKKTKSVNKEVLKKDKTSSKKSTTKKRNTISKKQS